MTEIEISLKGFDKNKEEKGLKIIDVDEFVNKTILDKDNIKDSVDILREMLEQLEEFNQWFNESRSSILFIDIEALKIYREWLDSIIDYIDQIEIVFEKDTIVYQIRESHGSFSKFFSLININICAIEMFLETNQDERAVMHGLTTLNQINEFYKQEVKKLEIALENK